VTNNWVSSGVEHRDRHVDRRVYTTYEHALIERYWKDPDFVWLFAANPTDTNFVYGWLCGELTDVGPLLHYVYVRRRMRDTRDLKLGVAGALLQEFVQHEHVDRLTHTRTTPAWEAWLRRNSNGLCAETFHNPYLAYDEFCPWRKR
jgi:hypothetical protein